MNKSTVMRYHKLTHPTACDDCGTAVVQCTAIVFCDRNDRWLSWFCDKCIEHHEYCDNILYRLYTYSEQEVKGRHSNG